MEREVLAVDSEFNQVLQSDACRLQQVQCYTSAPDHAFNRLFWGNKKSLVDAMESGISLREQIRKLHMDYYHGGLMKLAVIGGVSLDVLESWVVELFGDVKKGHQAKPEFKLEGPVWKAGKMYWLEAVKDVHILDLSWTLPCLHQEYLKKPEHHLAHLLGHEGRGSLLSFFKSRGWATSLSAGVGVEGMHHSSITYIFVMSIHLTDSGVEKIFYIIGFVFVYQYLKLLRQISPQERIFEELQNIGNMEFRFAEEQPQDDYAAELAENLHYYPPEHVIYGEYVYKTRDDQLIKHILGFFTPENMRVDVVSKSFTKSEGSSRLFFESVSETLNTFKRIKDEYLSRGLRNLFIKLELLEWLDGDSFEHYRSGLMAKLLEKDPSLAYETSRFWNQIVHKRYIFDMSKKEAEEQRSISKKDVVDWYRTYLKQSSPNCLRLVILVWGCNTNMKDAEAILKTVQVIGDPQAFKMSSKFYIS